MATKTFKIGLSATDKQNMAQDVYERVLALTFDEYDSSNTYNTGDFVVYNDALYQCKEDNVTGTWDASKWESATLQDLLDDVEGAVSSVSGKANVDGNYPTMTVGVADNLSPYDEESGDDQDEPFSFQATGTGNGSQPDFSTGSIALMKEKQGNTLVANQLIPTNKISVNVTITQEMVEQTSNWLDAIYHTQIGKLADEIAGHICLVFVKTGTPYIGIAYDANSKNVVTNDYTFTSTVSNGMSIITFDSSNNAAVSLRRTSDHSGNLVAGTYKVEFIFVDLTQMFNGDIPQDLLDNPDHFFRYYSGSLAYNTGELVNANSRYIKCIGMNQWDEEWEAGDIDSSTGENTTGNVIRSKDYIRVIPNTDYYFRCPSSSYIRMRYYDANKNYIGYNDKNGLGSGGNVIRTIPSNACFMRFTADTGYGTTYNHDISINLYYENETRCLTYEPYQVLTNTDTGTEVLRSAGSAKDYKEPNGTIHRLVGAYTFTGEENWGQGSNTPTGMYRYYFELPTMKSGTYVNGICSKFALTNDIVHETNESVFFGYSNNYLQYLSPTEKTVDEVKAIFANVEVQFELATPTTEQGTPFSENLIIDDFGSMEFAGTSGVPQGNLIFYPVDYKAFVDTLYDYTEGTPSNLALKSDLASDKTELQGVDTQLLNAIGGTLRQCLCVKESLDFENTDFVDLGSLDYVYYGDGCFVVSGSSSIFSIIEKNRLSTNYKNGGTLDYQNQTNRQNANDLSMYGWSYNVWFKNTAYTDATAFKNAMKGVLLAYEKA